MSNAEALLVKTWRNRCCNIGDCPAFHLTKQDVEYLIEAEKVRREKDIDTAVAELGVPSGTCLVTEREMVVNSACIVADGDFADYFRRQVKR